MKKVNDHIVIILEDEPAHIEVIQRALAGKGNNYQIHVTSTLKDFESLISKVKPDLILADLNLPDGSSLKLLSGDIENQSLPILVMTSYGDEEIAANSIKSGALDYIVKSPESLRNIEHIVERNIWAWNNRKKRLETEIKFRTLFETMDQGVIYQDKEGKIISMNPAAEGILGITASDQDDISILFKHWNAIHEDGSIYPIETHPASVAMETGRPVKDKIIGFYNSHKRNYVWTLVTAIPQFKDEELKPYQVYSTYKDITGLKNVEVELIKAKEKAEESDRLKSAFMANVSHEIRTPMNGVLGFAQLLKGHSLSEETRNRYIEIIETSGHRMLNIINDLIDISKIEAGLIELKSEKANIRELINELLLLFTPEAEKKGIKLSTRINLPDHEFIVKTDKTKVAQILTNLIKNAIKFTDSSGRIEIGCSLFKTENILIWVKDTGIGIEKNVQKEIFDRFKQVENHNTQEGLGLGLAISKAFVELLGGNIQVESEPGKGSLFSFTIPFDPADVGFIIETSESPVNLIPCLNILIAEDDDISYLYLKESLKQKNILTRRAKNGLDAIKMFKDHPNINLVLMDIKMPVMNGIEAIKHIKNIRPETPIIAQSAFATEKEINSSIEAGCNDYITKPIDINTLFKKISQYLSPEE